MSVSALALSALPLDSALAVLQIQCLPANSIQTGEHIACSDGFLRIDPDGTVTTGGCIVTLNAAVAGQCTLFNTGPAATRSARVNFTTNSIILNNGGSTVPMQFFRMSAASQPTPAPTMTFNATAVNNTVTINVGGRMNFLEGQTSGNYTGNVIINAVFN